ncbi:hypothetical protein VTJ83DRAFT_2803 [Remersonia thermophila]|uniref:Carboxylic ester hydrolase n=1 Tax=Remersonia thermophila TaxID=72144 RepID=A0ABR4DKS2_9PEZI
MALKRLAVLALASRLVSCTPASFVTEDPAPTETPSPEEPAEDIASSFVLDLLANLTQAEETQTNEKRSLFTCRQDSLTVNLGYAKYKGYHDASTGLNYWKGIRYAAPPTGSLRWQPPQVLPPELFPPTINAFDFGPVCPQAMPSLPYAPHIPGNEDCLFLNVYAPAGAKKLPVLVYIHEGGYGFGDGRRDMTEIINANDKGFVAVTIQYRLGAFGWLSSNEVKKKGVVNAGILDQALALAWVKLHICQFGGDPSRVTISGESAGGGSVMYHGIALGGNIGNLLYKQGIAASPYLPSQYKYNDPDPTANYYAFSQAAGCPGSGNVFNCLVGKDTNALQLANHQVTQAAPFGYWAFGPVTDNSYILNRPVQQFATKKMNGDRLLVGHNANEGSLFVPPGIITEADLIGWLSSAQLKNLSPTQLNTVLAANPNSANTDPSAPMYDTTGLSGPTALEMSNDANGQQQRANNIYAEATFACPTFWLASSYTKPGKAAYVYQYSVPHAAHTADMGAYFGPQEPNHSDDFSLAFRRIWGNFIRTGNPSISPAIANGAAAADPTAPHPISNWPTWNEANPKMVNLNITGGTPYTVPTLYGTTVTQYAQPGLLNAISVVNVANWEGGRLDRCNVYKSLAPSIPV